jgi:lysophospholipase L1-like esterase
VRPAASGNVEFQQEREWELELEGEAKVMGHSMRTVLLIAAVGVINLACAGEIVFTPLTHPAGELNSETNTGEWFRPDLGTINDVLPLKTRVFATKESVTDGVGMKWVFEKGSKGVFSFETKDFDPATAGITFFAKSSKPIKFRICKNVNQEILKTVEIGADWKKYDFAWSDMGGAKDWWQVNFQVIGAIEERTTLFLDRVGIESPTFDPNLKINPQTGKDDTISSKDIVYGAENLAKTLALLKDKKPFKIIAVGDSISAGAQTNRGTWGIEIPKGIQFRYFGHMAHLWEEEFGYKGITLVDCAHGGWTTKQLIAILEKDVFPNVGPNDLVVLQSGGNDIAGGYTAEQWKVDAKLMIAQLKTKTDQILVVSTTIPAKGPVTNQAAGISKALKEIVAEEKVAGADVSKFMFYRGPAFTSAIFANDYHPDYMGHITLGEMIAPILTGKHVTYPNE